MKVLISGAGIVGLAMARALAELGFEVKLIEKTDYPTTQGSGICLPANAVLGLESLGLGKALLSRAHQVNSITYAKHTGQVMARAPLNQKPLDQAPFVALLRSDLLALLSDELPVPIRFGHWIDRIEETADGTEVFLNGRAVSEVYDLVIVAEGIRSTSRELSFQNSDVADLGVTCWRYVCHYDDPQLQPIYYVGNDSAFMMYPIGPDLVYCYGQVSDPDRQYLKMDSTKALTDLFGHYCDSVRACLGQSEDIYGSRLESVSPTQAVSGRVVLVGDALHGCPPSLQQGVGMGLEDVHCLARQLRLNDITIEEALKRFEQERLPRVQWVVNESNRIVRLANLGRSFPGRLVRNMIIRKNGPANVAAWKKLLSD